MKKKKPDNEPSKYLVVVKTYRAKLFNTIGFYKRKDALKFISDCRDHGCTGKVYEEIKWFLT